MTEAELQLEFEQLTGGKYFRLSKDMSGRYLCKRTQTMWEGYRFRQRGRIGKGQKLPRAKIAD